MRLLLLPVGLLAPAGMLFLIVSCGSKGPKPPAEVPGDSPSLSKVKVIFDTDANNELDDQHALAYLLMNGPVFDLKGVTVNATVNGGGIEGHYREAERVLQLCNLGGKVPLLKGADGNYPEIAAGFDPLDFDGQQAVDFILEQTRTDSVVLVAVGKLTNIALALKKDPGLATRTRLVWLGSNYPDPGEYNQDNDTASVNYVLRSQIPFEMVTVRFGQPSGTAAVFVTQQEINTKMPGLGPRAEFPVTGRHGGTFGNFGDYSVNLFEHIDYHSDPPSRPLFDMVAVAVLKNPSWGQKRQHPAPVLIDNQWQEQPGNLRQISIWEYFDREAILADFFQTLSDPQLVSTPSQP